MRSGLRRQLAFVLASLAIAATAASPAFAQRGERMMGPRGAAPAVDEPSRRIVTIDRLVPHTSSIPAIKGQRVDLFVREKVREGALEFGAGETFRGRVVLFVHGGYSPSTLAFDVPYRDYSWLEFLAREGFDVFAMDMSGYGRSSRPLMNDPCNLSPGSQKLITPTTLSEPCEPKYKSQLVNSDSETDDINAVVDFIRKLRGVEKLSLVGWSGGGIRAGTFAARHIDKVDRFIIFASSNYSRKNPDDKPQQLPAPGAPMTLQDYETGIVKRWLGTSKCENTIEPGMPEMIWALNKQHDPLAANWGSGGLRAPTRTYWGWNANTAKKITVPVLMMVGEQDRLMEAICNCSTISAPPKNPSSPWIAQRISLCGKSSVPCCIAHRWNGCNAATRTTCGCARRLRRRGFCVIAPMSMASSGWRNSLFQRLPEINACASSRNRWRGASRE